MSILVGATSGLAGAAGQGPSADLGDTIEQSLRFRGGQFLDRAISGTIGTHTISFWCKIADNDNGYFFSFVNTGSGFRTGVNNSSGWNLRYNGAGNTTTEIFRDFSAWYHVVLSQDSTTAKVYVNNSEVISTNDDIHSSTTLRIGRDYASNNYYLDGYMAEFHFIDGQALNPTDFGKYNEDGVWVPQTYTGGNYGTNGCHLTFDSSQANGIGHDSSGNGNDFTATGFDTAAISGSNFDNDIDYNDTPTSNYPTFNQLRQANEKPSNPINANLGYDNTDNVAGATIYLPESGDFYWEISASTTFNIKLGVAQEQGGAGVPRVQLELRDGQSPSSSATGLPGTFTATTGSNPSSGVIGIHADMDNGVFEFILDGTVNGKYEGDGLAGLEFYAGAAVASGFQDQFINFGQHAFTGTAPAGTTDLQTNNLPEPTIKNGKEYFEAITYTGTKVQRDVTGLEFQPDLVWVKGRDNSTNHVLVDSVRGATEVLESDSAAIENTIAQSVNAFNSDGFAVGTDNDVNNNSVGNNSYVAWCWKAGGTAVSNTDGTITSSVSANTDAGFSIVSYTGTGANATVGHGLTEAPEFVIVKNRESSANFWIVGTEAHGFDKILFLNTNAAAEPSSNVYFSSSPSNTVVNLGTSGNTNRLDFDFIMYAWHSVEGYSKFGSYTGNGDADGPFIYLGFRPAWIMVKRATGGTANWQIMDTTRSTFNPADKWIEANEPAAEQTGNSFIKEDFLSNGFKPRGGASSQDNISGSVYVYMAFAESPFGGENAPPATAR